MPTINMVIRDGSELQVQDNDGREKQQGLIANSVRVRQLTDSSGIFANI